MQKVKLATMTCRKCGAVWMPRITVPLRCPRCQARLT